MLVGETIRLYPNADQLAFLKQACGISRLAYNWSLYTWKKLYEEDKEKSEDQKFKPNFNKLDKLFNTVKKEKFPFVSDFPASITQQSIKHLGEAYSRFFNGLSKAPKFHKKGIKERFSLSNVQFSVTDNKLKIAKLKSHIKLAKKLRYNGKLMNCKIFQRGGLWFVSITVETSSLSKFKQAKHGAVGIDLGIKSFATLSNGKKYYAPKPLKRLLKRLRRLNKQLSKKVKDSNNYRKAKTKLSKLHLKISNIRKDFLHKVTSKLVKMYDTIHIEDLHVKGMIRNRKLSRAISDLGFHEFKRQLAYKCEWYGRKLVIVDRFYPSSKKCNCCGYKNTNLKLSDRKWKCDSCGIMHDRDVNAAINILKFSG